MTIDEIITGVLRREGWPKFTNHPADKGGPTKGGITLETLQIWRNTRCSVEDLKNLTEDEARKIYYHRYVLRYSRIHDERIRIFLIDYAVNSWHDDAIAALQYALKSIGAYSGVVDGIWGGATDKGINVLNSLSGPNVAKVFKEIYHHRQDKFIGLALNDQKMKKFIQFNPELQIHNLHGWMNRLVEFL